MASSGEGALVGGVPGLQSDMSPVGRARRTCVPGLLAAVAALTAAFPAAAERRMIVADATVVRRTCPSAACGAVGRFNLGESVVSYETADGWVRVSPYYTAGCYEGQAAFVQSGPSDCTSKNGIEGGEFAEWVRAEFLKEPSELAASGSPPMGQAQPAR